MENMAKIINSTPNTTVKVPTTKYMIKKAMPLGFEYETHIKCNRCLNFVRSQRSEVQCESCEIIIKTANSDYFVYFPVEA